MISTISWRWLLLTLAVVAGALIFSSTVRPGPDSAHAAVGLSATPQFPASVTVGQTGVSVALTVAPSGNSDEPQDLTLIELNPSCTAASPAACVVGGAYDAGVFALSASGTGSVDCAGETFSIAGPDADGFFSFTPTATVSLEPGDSCVISFTVDVLAAPTTDVNGVAAGVQTNQYGHALSVGQDSGLVGEGLGSDQTTVLTPSTSVDASTDVDAIIVGDSVQITVTESNDGETDLTNPFVELSGGAIVGTLTLDETSPDFSGDDGDGILNPGETWQWLVTDTPLADATYVAIGHGTAPSGDDVTYCETPDTPPDGVFCDQDERAETSVSVSEIPDISIIKTAGDAADGAVLEIQPGGSVVFHYEVCNTGNVPLENGEVTDDNGTPADTSDDFTIVLTTTLAPAGEAGDCETVDSDSITIDTPPTCDETRLNVGTVVAFSVPLGTEVTANDDAEICTPPLGGLEITKTVDGQGAVDGVEFTVTGPGEFNETCTTPNCVFTDLEPGEYTISEPAPPPGTEFDSCTPASPVTVVAGETLTVTCNNISVAFEGCTPGYWKQQQHFDSWVGYTPDQSFEDVFGVDVTLRGNGQTTFDDPTLLQALDANGGGINALARHAVAALLNASNPDVEYPYTEAQIIAMVQAAVASGDFQTAHQLLADANEAGCPLN